MSKFTRYGVFAAIVDHGSLVSAADALCMSPSSVSKHLGKLEDELGVMLVERNTHQLAITEPGMQFYDRVNRILREVADAEESVQLNTASVAGVIRLSIPPVLLQTPFLSMMAEFNILYPDIRFDMRVTNAMDNLAARKVDIAFRIGESKDDQYVAIRLATLQVVFCASPEYLTRHGELSLRQLIRGQHLIIPSFLSASSNHKLLTIDPAMNKENKGLFHHADDTLAVNEMAAAGLGVSPTFDIAVSQDIAQGRLVPLSLSGQLPKQTLYMLYQKRDYMHVRIQAFKDFMKVRLPEVLAISE